MSVPNHYIVDFKKLTHQLLPTFLRKSRQYAWLSVLIAPIQELHSLFLNFRDRSIYKIVHTGQVWSLEKVLNDAFDNELRRMFITDGILVQPLFVYTPQEERPVYLGQRYIRSKDEIEDADRDFIINVPIQLQQDNETDELSFIASLTALTDYYKIASKTYRIQYYE